MLLFFELIELELSIVIEIKEGLLCFILPLHSHVPLFFDFSALLITLIFSPFLFTSSFDCVYDESDTNTMTLSCTERDSFLC